VAKFSVFHCQCATNNNHSNHLTFSAFGELSGAPELLRQNFVPVVPKKPAIDSEQPNLLRQKSAAGTVLCPIFAPVVMQFS